jgi:membrane-associated protease RseP (regulator of RpoE activity)
LKRSWHLQALLFILTVFSTYYAGRTGLSSYRASGLLYSVAIMSILLAHEMGHYFMSRRYGVPATLPYFIPLPISPFGTLGAVIKMSGTVTDKRALFDIGVAGPLCGFILAVPCAFIGIKLSLAVKVPLHAPVGSILGDPLLLKFAEWLIVGDLPTGFDILIHPIAYAGWVGLFITALNLLPIGQLDGGHIIYGVFGAKSRLVSRALIPVLLLLSVFYNVGWFVLVALLLIFGIGHPPPVDAETPLDLKRKILAFVMLFVFVVSFVPAPFPGTSLIELMKALSAK